jgi:hypothetical protein
MGKYVLLSNIGNKIEEPKDVSQGCEISPVSKFHSIFLLPPPPIFIGGDRARPQEKNALQNILWLFLYPVGNVIFLFK